MRNLKTINLFFALAACVTLLCFGKLFIEVLNTEENILNADSETIRNYATVTANTYNNHSLVNRILDTTRSLIKSELLYYNFADAGVEKLEDLLTESGGNPIRSVVVSSWRSGSTFLGDLLNSVPGNFYHYEPFLKDKINQIRNGTTGNNAIKDIEKMLKCNFEGLDDYFEYGKTDPEQFSFNTRLWRHCKENNQLCHDPKFTGQFCKLFPFQSMKLCRVRMPLFEPILMEKELNAKIVLLVRDPRGVMQSRQHRTFCVQSPDCWNLKTVCNDMTNDYRAAIEMRKKYPGRIFILRFEDLALNVNETSHRLLKFLRLDFTRSVEEYLQSHTGTDVAGVSSTTRVSRDVPFKWKKILYFDFVQRIQEACTEAMDLFGYKMAHNSSHMTDDAFNPIEERSFDWREIKNG